MRLALRVLLDAQTNQTEYKSKKLHSMNLIASARMFKNRFYFSDWRNRGNGLAFLIVCSIIILVLGYVGMFNTDERVVAFINSAWFYIPSLFLLILYVLYFVQAYAWSYKDTDLMLQANGKGKWSVHMGFLASMSSLYYVWTSVRCLKKNKTTLIDASMMPLLQEIDIQGLKGVITLESHLYGDQQKRASMVQSIMTRFPRWQCKHYRRAKNLGWYYAFELTALRNALRKKRKQAKKPRLTRQHHVGVIEITIV